jgi:hypothetical protein
MPERTQMIGTISSCGFAGGDRFVIGSWRRSPVGPTTDVMWAKPDGTRVLLAPDERTAAFVTAVYEFEEARVVPFSPARAEPGLLDLTAGPLRIRLEAGRTVLWLPPRPRWVTRYVEAPLAAALLGVRTWGTSPTGVQEWYQARALRFVVDARATVDGVDLGGPVPLDPACGFGFSEAPRRPSIVTVRPTLQWPSGAA